MKRMIALLLVAALSQGCYESTLTGDWVCTGPACGDAHTQPEIPVETVVTDDAAPPGCEDASCMELCVSLGYASGTCLASGVCACAPDPSVPETCGDGLDNDRDGVVDEGCECVLGETRPCWTGTEETRNIGACRDGTQVCAGGMYSTSWYTCWGSVLPEEEVCDGAEDEDCDGLADVEDPDCCQMWPEDCMNCSDDNCDGLIDATDPDCFDETIPEGHCGCCVPGTYRWCDYILFCSWGRQQCLPDGTWGNCDETSAIPEGCGGYSYDATCCMLSGDCCQLSPFSEEPSGNCDGIIAPCPEE